MQSRPPPEEQQANPSGGRHLANTGRGRPLRLQALARRRHRAVLRVPGVSRIVRSYRSLCRSWVVAYEDTLPASPSDIAQNPDARALPPSVHPHCARLRGSGALRAPAFSLVIRSVRVRAFFEAPVRSTAAPARTDSLRACLGIARDRFCARAVTNPYRERRGVLVGDNPRATERSVRASDANRRVAALCKSVAPRARAWSRRGHPASTQTEMRK